jgi:hypothetical protein
MPLSSVIGDPSSSRLPGFLSGISSHLRLLLLVGDQDQRSHQSRVFREFLQNRCLHLGLSCKSV